ncbi:MAG: RIP metalloprotease RseP [Puniceicoccales bacterium]|jgi:RIP metalloprotease RseP|nr:RIP metalloprotease RseP [Puniceicoccales bacterium]
MGQHILALGGMLFFFGGSIFVHEWGHFLAAKRRKLKVPRFSIGVGPRILSWTRGETEYCLSLFPFGGYVALPQMGEVPVLEGSSPGVVPARPLKFYDKFIVAVMGAVFNLLFALLLATILWKVGLPVSEAEKTTTVGYVLPSLEENVESPASKAGLRAGDRILAVDGTPVKSFTDINKAIVLGRGRTANGDPQVILAVERDSKVCSIVVYPQRISFNNVSKERIRFIGISPAQSMVVEKVCTPATLAGLCPGDRILSINGVRFYSPHALEAHLNESKEKMLEVEFERDGRMNRVSVVPEKYPLQRPWMRYSLAEEKSFLDLYPVYEIASVPRILEPTTPCSVKVLDRSGLAFEPFVPESLCAKLNHRSLTSLADVQAECAGSVGVHLWEIHPKKNPSPRFVVLPAKNVRCEFKEPLYGYRLGISFIHPEILTYPSPLEQFHRSVATTFETFSRLVDRRSDVKIKNLMGPPGIMRLLHHYSGNDFRRLLSFTVLININLAILNLMPIPVLDGGCILFALIEHFRKKPLSDRWMGWIQTAFVFFFLGLMLYVSFFDLCRWRGNCQSQRAFEKELKLAVEET